MQTSRFFVGCVAALIALLAAIALAFLVRGKGPILSPGFLWLTPEEKKKADKKAKYRYAAFLCAGICGTFAFSAVALFTEAAWAMLAYYAFGICTGVAYFADLVRRWLKKRR